MQDKSYISLKPDYDMGMPAGRPTKMKRPSFGEGLAQTRQGAGLTQQQLAEKLDTTQRVITYWEREKVALRPEQLAALADALGVTADFLLGREIHQKRGNGPAGKVRRVFDDVSKLPRRQQDKVVEFVSAFVKQYAING